MVLYKIKFFFLLFISLCFFLKGQITEFSISAGNTCLFSGNVYCFGIENKEASEYFVVYQLNTSLDTISSKRFKLTFKTGTDKIRCWSDTLHGFLTIYVPEGKNQKVSLYRFNPKFELLKEARSLDVARLYPVSGFENQLYYSGRSVYAVQTQKDSTGLQFYINKHELKPDFESFEYEKKWQFPFERKNIRSVQIFHASQEALFVFVHVFAGAKTGQWLLKINVRNGQLIKATKLNFKNEENSYMYGNYFFDARSKSLLLTGHKFSSKQYLAESGILSVSGASAVSMYVLEIDSIGDVQFRQDYKLAISPNKGAIKNTASAFLLQIKSFTRLSEHKYLLDCDVYKMSSQGNCYVYANSFAFGLTKDNENYLPEKKVIEANINIERFLNNNDKLDMNGKLCVDSTGGVEQLFVKNPSSPVKLLFANDSLNQPYWVLCKSNSRKAVIQLSAVKLEKKIYQVVSLEEIQLKLDPVVLLLPGRRLLLGSQNEAEKYVLKALRP